jgi:eukaryotic-like serine/threonine-protein kinase
MLKRGDTFGSYRIVGRLKAGGMAQLYLARREGAAGFSRPVALKVIHAHLARQAEFVRMFVDEATLSSKIHDPNVVHVEDLGNVDGTLYLAMEYVHGVALANVLKAARSAKRRLAPAFVAHVGAQIASGLHAAHETTDEAGTALGIVHRDVSPQNVLLAFKGHIKLIDFGVAKAFVQQHETGAGAIQGKLGYMPPEQARSEAIDRRADVYALGIVLWEMLAGRRLFDAEHELALVERVRKPKIDPPSHHGPDVPPALEAVVMRMLAPNAVDRPATALDVKRLLLDAVPDARSVEAPDVAALLRALVPNEIEKQNGVLATLAERTSSVEDDEPATERRIDPSEALDQLTVVLAPKPRMATRAFALVAGVALVAIVVALLSMRSKKEGAVAFPEPPPLPSTAPVESAEIVDSVEIDESTPAASTSASAAPSAASAPKKPAVTTKKKPKPRCQIVGNVELCE